LTKIVSQQEKSEAAPHWSSV